ncbi:sialate O-acetylesterase [Spirosoma taeanense]|uniref:sialate O-acetylesterase n=1 Tax=Spirosoma taeanense TaxID=2735870 RepID=UPI001F035413|nr:sialate O-acetylesterase [Spirosoma taeanense]
MRLFVFTLVFAGMAAVPGWGQAVVTLREWPARLQLYQRNPTTSQCNVAISGRVPAKTVTAISLVVYRNQQRQQYARTSPDSLTGSFAFSPLIKAELAEYSFRLFAHSSAGDSVQVAGRDSIVCGDVYLIMGQSNAIGRFDTNAYRNEFCRTFGVNQGDKPYNPADTAWCLTNTSEGINSLWGVELQRLICQQQGIPTAVINGAAGSTSLYNHTTRDAGQPDNLNTLYGRLLYRVRRAGVANQVQTMIWRQGEAEAAGNPDDYARLYPQLYSYWKQDYPNLKRVYHTQINLLTDASVRAGALRDYQRRSNELFPDNVSIATVGLPAYQGLHYGEAGYRQFGAELYRLVARDFYGSTDTSNIQSPNVRRIFYSTPDQSEITLEFEPGQVMHWPMDTILLSPANGGLFTQSLNNYIYTDYPNGETGLLKSVTEQGNRLILKLNKSVNARHLTYLPSSYRDSPVGFYTGPVIQNQRGMRALTFHQVSIAAPLPVAADLRAIPIDTSAIQLAWSETTPDVEQWLIERADSSGIFKLLARVPGSAKQYEDLRRSGQKDSLQLGAVYRYRVRSVGRQAEAAYSPVVSASLQLVLAVEEPRPLVSDTIFGPATLVYPNPASDQVWVRLPLDWYGDAVALTLTSEAGLVVLHRTERISAGATSVRFSVADLPTGVYILTMQHRLGGVRCRLVVSR